jgi:hypothetical protein
MVKKANKITIYVEGGGETNFLKTRCREGFQKLFQKCGFNRMPKLVACGSRSNAFHRFCTAHQGNDVAILLVDSEDPMEDIDATWAHLKTRDNWDKPAGADNDQVLMMTTCMESWIVADRDSIRSHYGSELNENQLPSTTDLEAKGRAVIQDSLVTATQNCSNNYEKGKRSFQVLAVLVPETLSSLLPSFDRDLGILREKLK